MEAIVHVLLMLVIFKTTRITSVLKIRIDMLYLFHIMISYTQPSIIPAYSYFQKHQHIYLNRRTSSGGIHLSDQESTSDTFYLVKIKGTNYILLALWWWLFFSLLCLRLLSPFLLFEGSPVKTSFFIKEFPWECWSLFPLRTPSWYWTVGSFLSRWETLWQKGTCATFCFPFIPQCKLL